MEKAKLPLQGQAGRISPRSAYNQPVVANHFSFRSCLFAPLLTGAVLSCFAGITAIAQAPAPALFSSAGQPKADSPNAVGPKADSLGAAGAKAVRPNAVGRILLVLPFDNRSGQPSLEWVREASAELLESRFASAGFAPMSRADRLYALDHLGLPQGFQPSRASSLKLAQTLDADAIVVGSFRTEGNELIAEAQLVDVPHLHMSAPVSTRGQMQKMVDIVDALAWMLTRQLDPSFSIPEETFVAAGRDLRLDAFEQYIHGITEPDQQERQRHLEQAVKLSPGYSPAWMALGRDGYNGQHYEEAAAAFARVSPNSPDALEAGFYRGISLIFSGDYPRAEAAFAGVAKIMPLAEVLNNQGVAMARHNQDPTALFRQAVAADPNNADYHFNLALSLKRHGNAAEAQTELAQCLKLRSTDAEAQDLEEQWKKPSGGQIEPLERIIRSFDAAAFRQATQLMNQMEAAKLEALDPHEKALRLAAQGAEALDHGLLLDAERLYQAAAANDNQAAVVNAGLAAVREQSGDAQTARKEARLSLELMPSPEAYLVLARLDLAAGHSADAAESVNKALAIDASNRTAQDLRQQIAAKGGK